MNHALYNNNQWEHIQKSISNISKEIPNSQKFSQDDNWDLLHRLDFEFCRRYQQKFSDDLDNCSIYK